MKEVWSISVRLAVLVVILLSGVWLLSSARPLVQALIIAVLLAYLLSPLVNRFSNLTHSSHVLSVGVVYTAFLLVLVAMPILAGTAAINLGERLVDNVLRLFQELEILLKQPYRILGFTIQPESFLESLEIAALNSVSRIPGGPVSYLTDITTNLLWGLVIVVSLYYLLKDGYKIRPWLLNLIPDDYRSDVGLILNQIDQIWSIFLRVQLLLWLVLLILILSGSAFVIWLFTSGILRLSALWLIVMLVGVYALAQQVDNLWLRPQFLGKSLDLHPGVVFVGLIAALALTGVLGALIVVPVMASARVVMSYVHHRIVGSTDWPAPTGLKGSSKVQQVAEPAPEAMNEGQS